MMDHPADRKLRVFLCHASEDKPIVYGLYERLILESWIEPWLDKEKLLPGQDWNLEIEKAVETTDAVVAFLSKKSVTKEGYVQKELRKVLDVADEKLEGTIFIIPLRLDDCEVPRSLKRWEYLDYFPDDRDLSYKRLLQSLIIRANHIGIYERGRCYICNEPILSSQSGVRCLYCNTAYHKECWENNIGCYVMGCKGNYEVGYFYQPNS
jgi:hypothetical protein